MIHLWKKSQNNEAVMTMPGLLLQKPLNESKSKDHFKELELRVKFWKYGNSLDLFQEILSIQNKKSLYKTWKIGQTSGNFEEEIQKVNVNGTLKLLTNNIQNGFLLLN